MKGSLDPRIRERWDAVIGTEGAGLGLAGCRPFMENKPPVCSEQTLACKRTVSEVHCMKYRRD